MRQKAYFLIPWPLDAVPITVTFKASASRPGIGPNQTGTILSIYEGDTRTRLTQFEIKGTSENPEYTFLLPAHLLPNPPGLKLRFEVSQTFQPGQGDSRQLGLALFNLNLVIASDQTGFNLTSLLGLLGYPLLITLINLELGLIATLLKLPRKWRFTVQGLAGLSLIGGLVWCPLALEVALTGWFILLGLFASLIWLGKLFHEAASGLPISFTYILLFFPLMPLAQLLFSNLDSSQLNPGLLSLFIYWLALVGSIAAYLLLPNRRLFQSFFLGFYLIAAAFLFAFNQWWIFDQNFYNGGDFLNYFLPLRTFEKFQQPLYSLQEMAQTPYKAVRMPPQFSILFWPFITIFKDVNYALLAWRIISELLLVPIIILAYKIVRNL